MVVVGGRPMVGALEWYQAFEARGVRRSPLAIDGRLRIAEAALVRAIGRCPIAEPGIQCA
jgi:hypothetical protein